MQYVNCCSNLRFQALTAASMKLTDVSGVLTASMIRITNKLMTLIIEDLSASETSVNFYETT
jgi:hypothetical protein